MRSFPSRYVSASNSTRVMREDEAAAPIRGAAQVHMLRMAAAWYLSSACARSERNDFVPKDFHRINSSRRNSRDAFRVGRRAEYFVDQRFDEGCAEAKAIIASPRSS
jgi:hypothetical protein